MTELDTPQQDINRMSTPALEPQPTPPDMPEPTSPDSIVAPQKVDDTIEERPRLTDPAELDIIRQIYFEPITPKSTRNPEVDSTELWDRMLHKKNRNQSR